MLCKLHISKTSVFFFKVVSKEERSYSRYSPQLCFTSEFRVKCIKLGIYWQNPNVEFHSVLIHCISLTESLFSLPVPQEVYSK